MASAPGPEHREVRGLVELARAGPLAAGPPAPAEAALATPSSRGGLPVWAYLARAFWFTDRRRRPYRRAPSRRGQAFSATLPLHTRRPSSASRRARPRRSTCRQRVPSSSGHSRAAFVASARVEAGRPALRWLEYDLGDVPGVHDHAAVEGRRLSGAGAVRPGAARLAGGADGRRRFEIAGGLPVDRKAGRSSCRFLRPASAAGCGRR